jgi:hypothetical protein
VISSPLFEGLSHKDQRREKITGTSGACKAAVVGCVNGARAILPPNHIHALR